MIVTGRWVVTTQQLQGQKNKQKKTETHQWMAEECPPGSSDCQREELMRYCIAWVLV